MDRRAGTAKGSIVQRRYPLLLRTQADDAVIVRSRRPAPQVAIAGREIQKPVRPLYDVARAPERPFDEHVGRRHAQGRPVEKHNPQQPLRAGARQELKASVTAADTGSRPHVELVPSSPLVTYRGRCS